MIKFPSPSLAAAALLLSLPSLTALAQTTSNTVTASGGAAPPASPLPPAGTASKLPAADVTRTRRLVRVVEENTDNVKAQGDFGAQLWLVQGRKFFEDWKKPETPTISPVDIVPRGQAVYTAIIFYGAAHDGGGLSNVTYSITIKRPDGSVYEQRNDAIGWQNLAPSDPKQLQLGRDSIGITIGPDDPAGLYTADVTVRDNVSRVELPLRSHFLIQ